LAISIRIPEDMGHQYSIRSAKGGVDATTGTAVIESTLVLYRIFLIADW